MYCIILFAFANGAPLAPPSFERPPLANGYHEALVEAVHHFAREGELRLLQAIVEKHPKVGDAKRHYPQPRKPVSTDGYTALHFAAANGRDDIVAYLIERGANLERDSGGGWTALHLAARAGHLRVVQVLVEAGANRTAKTKGRPAWFGVPPSSPPGAKPTQHPAIPRRTPMELAQEAKHMEVVNYLKSKQ